MRFTEFLAVLLRDWMLQQVQTIHRTTQSVGATGGVYKGQGVDDLLLLGIPRLGAIAAMIHPHHDTGWQVAQPLQGRLDTLGVSV